VNAKTNGFHHLQIVALCLAMTFECGTSAGMSSSDLGNMPNARLVELLGDQKWGDKAFAEIVARLERDGHDQQGDLAKELFDKWQKSTNEMARAWSFQGLRLLRSQAAADVLTTQLLTGRTSYERQMAAHGLGQLGQTNAISVLEAVVFTDKGTFGDGPSVGRRAVFSLGEMGGAGAPALMRLWNNENVRRVHEEAVLSAMGFTKDRRFVPILIGVLAGAGERSSRDNAAWALGEIGDATALPELNRYTDDSNKNVKENVLKAIEKIQQRVKEHARTDTEQPNEVPEDTARKLADPQH